MRAQSSSDRGAGTGISAEPLLRRGFVGEVESLHGTELFCGRLADGA